MEVGEIGSDQVENFQQELGVKLKPIETVGFPGVCGEKKNKLKNPKSGLLEEGGNVLSSPGVKNNTDFFTF